MVLNEAILRWPVGGREIMARQLDRLVELGDLANVSLRVLPFAAGLHRGISAGPFVLLTFPLNGDGKPSEPPTVYVNGLTGALYLDKPHEIGRYMAAFDGMWEVSLDDAASRNLIHQAATEMRK
ncbi:DUF5753 domain-containing protein [Nocardiopsis deserti]|uniref:DUF5753 domain-containing protein n=1 Tax=Nocardiopsis deserti TaxID=2605988 RepID=UPI001238F076|nr:DUF5753 domain-containing protein [Nocardiopsis deserti]